MRFILLNGKMIKNVWKKKKNQQPYFPCLWLLQNAENLGINQSPYVVQENFSKRD